MKTRATVAPWKHSRHYAVHDGLELVAVCVYKKGALAVAELVDLANGLPIKPKPLPMTGTACHCKPGLHRDNCPDCEGTGRRIDWKEYHRRKTDARPDPIDHGSNCANCAAPLTDPDEPFCESCAALDPADRHWIAAGNLIPATYPDGPGISADAP